MGGMAGDGGASEDQLMRELKANVKRDFDFNIEYVNDVTMNSQGFGDFLTKAEEHLNDVMASAKCVDVK